MFLVAMLVTGGAAALSEYLLARRGHARPWIYGWAVACPTVGLAVAIRCLEGGLGTAWAVALALVFGAGAYPLGRTLFEYSRTSSPRYQYLEDPDTRPLDEPTFQMTDFGGASMPLRPERPEEPEPTPTLPVPRLIDWGEGLSREGLTASAVSIIILAGGLGLVATYWPRPWRTPADHVAAVLAEDGYPLARVRTAETTDVCVVGRETPYHWSAPGVEGVACRSKGGRVSYRVTRRWPG